MEPGDSVTVCTIRGQWKAIISQVSVNRTLYGACGWFQVDDCENQKLNGAVFDLKLIEHCGKTAHFNCDKISLSQAGQLQHHYNCWVLDLTK